MAPSSDWVNPKSLPQSSRIPLRIEKPIPAAMRVMKLARKRRLWPGTTAWAEASTSGSLFGGRGSLEVHRLIAANGFEIEQNEKVDYGHGEGNKRVAHQRPPIAFRVGLAHDLLLGIALVRRS